ncbi:RelA/SpoT domain-containing protein [Dyella japonica]|uniref:RelA/SpoT domain-containing protein n=1 Tax=Dyella japonica TaxID=231455 RepID=UPI0009E45E82|nr:RelA/SpoT domain-containing protein [Dyella japonica]
MEGKGFPGGSRKRVNKAGDRVREKTATDDDFAVINEWRGAHRYVINTFQASLRQRAKAAGEGFHVGQRLKRAATIFDKLERQPKMELGRMDDVAGVRLIVPSIDALYEFRQRFHAAHFQHERRSKDDQYDYIAKPKSNGYRGIHDIYAYQVNSKHAERAAGLFIEVQYRTLVQHAWATANEVIGYITDSEPKFDRGDKRIGVFMEICSEILARGHEQRPGPHPELSNNALIGAYADLEAELGLMKRLASLRVAKVDMPKNAHYILIFNREGKLEVKEYTKNKRALAALFHIEAERPDSNVVLVGASSPEEVQFAFRNYFSNTVDFLGMIAQGLTNIVDNDEGGRLARTLYALKTAKGHPDD